ncbi:desampylase [Haloarchaeobius sp. TZWWS8]|uniref:desampylase n=1 Tax=Haloarchaeobius sp. TZWWS8 TaxID=3446121 RepID=UPI003EBF7AF3
MRFAGDTRDRLVDLARAGIPNEVCGVLGGRLEDSSDGEAPERIVESVHPVPNVADSPRTRYGLDPAETVRVIDDLEESGETLVGFYHSHPRGPDGPSETDHELATWADTVYCIVSLAGEPTVRSWLWTGERFQPA